MIDADEKKPSNGNPDIFKRCNRTMTSTTAAGRGPKDQDAGGPVRQRCFFGACLAHALHDGYTDQLYALLPVWQSDFGLSYVGLAVVRALYFGTMGGLQVPADRIASKLSPRIALTLATFIAAFGYLVMALPFGFPGLCIGLILAGVGSSVQHPRASLLVTSAFGKAPRGPLSIYNFSGDLGKATFPAIIALLLPILAWRPVVGLMYLVGIVVGFTLLVIGAAATLPHLCREKSRCRGARRARFLSAPHDRRIRYRDSHGISFIPAVSHP